jgi:Cellulase M and related proteins
MEELLEKLVRAKGAPGTESQVREVIENSLEGAESLRTDEFGNLIAEKGGEGKKLMLIAHMDSIGLAVRR